MAILVRLKMSPKCFFAAVVLVCLISLVLTKDVTWLYNVAIGDSVTMNCNVEENRNLTISSDNAEEIRWILPDGKDVSVSWSSPDGNVKVTGSSKGDQLQIQVVKLPLNGFYHCVLIKEGNKLFIKRGLNVYGMEWSNVNEMYKQSALIGGIAAGVVLIVFTTGCCVYAYRWKKAPSRRHKLKTVPKKLDEVIVETSPSDSQKDAGYAENTEL